MWEGTWGTLDCKTRTDKIIISHSYYYYDSVRDHLSELNLHYAVSQSDVGFFWGGGGLHSCIAG